MQNLDNFRRAVKEYMLQARRKSNGKPATMEDLALTIGFTREALSKKLNGHLRIDDYDVRNIVRSLAKLRAITNRGQARYLLKLMDVSDFDVADWNADPLRTLEDSSSDNLDEIEEEHYLFETQPDMLPRQTIPLEPLATSTPQPVTTATLEPPAAPIPEPIKRRSITQRQMLAGSIILLLVTGIVLYMFSHNMLNSITSLGCPVPSTADSEENIYAHATCHNRLILDDSLQTQSQYHWDQNDDCTFQDGGYSIVAASSDTISECFAQKGPILRDFAIQVNMSVVQGFSGGVIFRAENTDAFDRNAVVYRIAIDINGAYNFYLGKSLSCHGPPVSTNWCRSTETTYHRGQRQENTLTIVALDDTIYFYSNGQYIDRATNTYSHSGYIGLFANGAYTSTRATFRSLKIWTW